MSTNKPRKRKPKKKVKIIETKLGRRQSLGLWEKIDSNTSLIAIDERLKGFQRLMIVLHEALHESCPDWTEEKVMAVSEFLASVLWKCDYRHVDHSGEAKPTYKSTVKKKPKKPVIYRKEIWEDKAKDLS